MYIYVKEVISTLQNVIFRQKRFLRILAPCLQPMRAKDITRIK